MTAAATTQRERVKPQRKNLPGSSSRLEEIVKHLDIPSSLKEFGVPEEDLEALVSSGMEVQRLLVNNPRTVTPEDARALYKEIL